MPLSRLLLALLALAPLARGDAALDALARRAAQGNPSEREQALHELARQDTPEAGAILRRCYAGDPDPRLVQLAGHLLSERFCLEYCRALVELVREGRHERAASAIDHAMDETARFLRALDLWAALELDAPAAQRRLAAHLGSTDIHVVCRAAELIGLCGPATDGRPLLPLLRHADPLVRVEAVLALTKLTGFPCDEALVERALTDEVERVRRHAVWAVYERGGAVSIQALFGPHASSPNAARRNRALEALSQDRLRHPLEEGPVAFKYRGQLSSVLVMVRAAETGQAAQLVATDPEAGRHLQRTLELLGSRAPKFAFHVRYSLRKITTSAEHATGTYVATRVFNIRPATARQWSMDHLAKTLVHDATHAYLAIMGEKAGEHRGEAECFEEAFWADTLLTGRPVFDFRSELETLLAKAHWTHRRDY